MLGTDLWVSVQVLLFQLSTEVPPGPLGVRMGVTGLGVLRCWGLGRGVQVGEEALSPRLAEGLASCLTGPGPPGGGRGLSAARSETLASGWHSGQIRP